METRSEVDRLQEVYREYAFRGFGQSKWSLANQGNQAAWGECRRELQELLKQTGFFPLQHRRVLDVGCGTGDRLAGLMELGAAPENLFGVDLIPERIRVAQQHHPRVTFQLANAETLPFADGIFDLVAVFTVFTSILNPQMVANICREIDRVLVSGGGLIWYDFRMHNPLNRHVRGISRNGIQKMFPAFEMTLKTISLLPPLARRLGRLTHVLYSPLSWVPFLRSHYLGVLTKP
ncbi:MAG TPA: class I SAM-dependent methyltransferase [Candidatus Binatia bacterium]|jgi:ubiquinone/menaquinone biosynthesis C-methylase UbiE|nr:class I SAM-dependent methyltransferase [Candidatus Binatia bacterium]